MKRFILSFIQIMFFKFWLGGGQQPPPPIPALGAPLVPDDVYLLLRRVKVTDGSSEQLFCTGTLYISGIITTSYLHLRHIPDSLFQCVQEMQTLRMMMRICVVPPVDQNHFHMQDSRYQVPVMVGNYFNNRL
jgi:hypothetical protein